MKIKVFKFIFNFLLLITPLIFFAHNVYALNDYVVVEKSRIDLSPDNITRCNLNDSEIKMYLIKRIELSEALPRDVIKDIKEKESSIRLFVMKKNLFNYRGEVLLYIWIPYNTKQPNGVGELHILPLTYEIRTRSSTV